METYKMPEAHLGAMDYLQLCQLRDELLLNNNKIPKAALEAVKLNEYLTIR